ncbi:MAG: penicillin-binding protein 1A [Alphaproteobacteria bacterium]|nr:penicillin-binding protein 1A [Alphaproteobacteria bacterium]
MKLIANLISVFFFGCFLLAAAVFVVVLHYSIGLPDYQQLAVYRPPVTSRLYASDGSLLTEYASEKRTFIPVDKIPPLLRAAFISAEDKTFYTHGGIDVQGLARAVITNIRNIGTGRRVVGASTITQQVAKNFLLGNERSISRKIREALLARKMEQTFTKDHILELYLNEIYLGQSAYGVASAALHYFNKDMSELTLGQAAYLAALPKGPNNYHPVRHPEAAKERRDWVLSRMHADGYIAETDMLKAAREPIRIVERPESIVADAQYYAEEVRRFISDTYGENAIYDGGLFIRTSLDPHLQRIGAQVLADGLLAYDRRHGWRGPVAHFETANEAREKMLEMTLPTFAPAGWRHAVVYQLTDAAASVALSDGETGTIAAGDLAWARAALPDGKIARAKIAKASDVLKVGDIVYVSRKSREDAAYLLRQMPEVEGALVAMDPHTGRVLAMAGGFSYQKSQFNRAVQAWRQPGSSFKPFVYLAALDSGYTPSSLILDAPIVMEKETGELWKPQNYGRVFYGPSTLRVGVEKSRNLMTIRLAQAIGMRKITQYGRKFGISDNLKPDLSTALGSGETTLARLTTAYGSLVNGGKQITPSLIDRVQDRNGKTIYKHDERACPACAGDAASPDEPPALEDARAQIQDPASAYQMVNILTGVIERGTGSAVRVLKRPLGGKSGTSNSSFDAWFVGFSPDLVVGVWIGFDNPQTLGPNDTGGVVAAPIFRDFMQRALQGQPVIPFRVPSSVKLVRINAETGEPAAPGDKNIILEAYRVDADLFKPTKIIGRDITIKDENIPDLGGFY